MKKDENDDDKAGKEKAEKSHLKKTHCLKNTHRPVLRRFWIRKRERDNVSRHVLGSHNSQHPVKSTHTNNTHSGVIGPEREIPPPQNQNGYKSLLSFGTLSNRPK